LAQKVDVQHFMLRKLIKINLF